MFLLFAHGTSWSGKGEPARRFSSKRPKPAVSLGVRSPPSYHETSPSARGHIAPQEHQHSLDTITAADPRGLPHPPHCKASHVVASLMWLVRAARSTARGRGWPAGMDGGTGSWWWCSSLAALAENKHNGAARSWHG